MNYCDTIVTMPPKKVSDSQKAVLAKARESRDSSVAQYNIASTLSVSQEDLSDLKTQITLLELALKKSEETCARLLKELDAANSKIAELKLELQAEHDHFKSTYQSLRTEHHAQQHSDKQKQVLAETISQLKETTEIQLQKQRELEKSAAMTESEMKQVEFANSQLQAELLSNIQLFSKELALSKEMLRKSQAALKGSKSEIYNLKQKCSHSAKKQENAVRRAKSKVVKESTTFYLLQKGVYSKEV